MIKTVYKNYIDEINKDLKKAEKEKLVQVCKMLTTTMKDKISSKGISVEGQPPKRITGRLRKGIRHEIEANNNITRAWVGLGSPGYAGHILEFGTMVRSTKGGKKGPHSTGIVKPHPFVFSTFSEKQEEVINILSGAWI